MPEVHLIGMNEVGRRMGIIQIPKLVLMRSTEVDPERVLIHIMGTIMIMIDRCTIVIASATK